MATLQDLMVDKEKMEKGVWKDFVPFYGVSVRLLIASSNNPEYIKEVGKLIRENLKAIRGDNTGKVEQESIKPAVARYLLLGWEGIDDDKGSPIPYSYDAALSILGTPELYHLYDYVRIQAEITANFRKKDFEDAVKN